MTTATMSIHDVIIVGAGPSGLAAAIAAKQHHLDSQIIEQGTLVDSIYRFPPQMVFFTTPELMEIGGLPFVSPYDKPTRLEALRYYRKVVDTYKLDVTLEERVLSVTRDDNVSGADADPVFAVETRAAGPSGIRRV
ncbi:MAG: NAD(P)-binding domain-containing protein, partial [Acidobacteriaceae bacterium]|nr:NAD(P)-binding domain-containing protein [Acidobacteriaceae bacterium]